MTRIGVAHRLTAGLLTILLSTLLAAGLALYGISQFRDGFDRIAVTRVGNLATMAQIAQQAQAIAVTAPRVAAATDRFERERAMRHVHDLFDQFAVLFAALDSAGADNASSEGLQRHQREFVVSLKRLDELVAERQAVEKRLQATLDTLESQTRAARTVARTPPDPALPTGGEPESRAAREWLISYEDAATTLLLAATPSPLALDRRASSYRESRADLDAATRRLANGTAPSLATFVHGLDEVAEGVDGVLALRGETTDLQRQIQGALNRINIVSNQFVAAASNLFADARGAVERDRTAFSALLDRGADALGAIVLIGAAVAALVFVYVRRDVIQRLVELQRCMRARADGNPVPIPIRGSDELADMASACAFFVREIEQRETDLRTAKEAAEAAVQELQTAQTQLVAKEKMAALGGLVAGIAHEINTPIGTALTAASFLVDRSNAMLRMMEESRPSRSEFQRAIGDLGETAGMVMVNIERAATLIQSFKQVAADQTSNERRCFPLDQCIRDAVASLEPRLRAAQVEVTASCPAGLMLDSFPGVFVQLLSNLVVNSLLHAFDGRDGGTLSIAVAFDPDHETVELRFADDGNGMAPDVVARIFDPFFTTKRGRGGTGLGLHIVHNIMSQTLGGRITVSSEQGRGTTFVLSFPRTSPSVPDGAVAAQQSRPQPGERPMTGNSKQDSMLGAFATKGGASEQRHAADHEQRFRVEARRNRLLAEWAAGLMGLDADATKAYVSTLIETDLTMPGDADVVARVLADVAARGLPITEGDIRRQIGEFEQAARLSLSAS